MRFASAVHQNTPIAVVVERDLAFPIENCAELGPSTSLSFLRNATVNRDVAIPVKELQFRPVVPNPGKVVCVGLNYLAHIEESGRDVPEYPVLFTKFASTLTGPYDDIDCPQESSSIDYEGELAVVIGESCRRVSRERALDVVAGCTVSNDVSMRDFQNKTHQWLPGKAWDASTPVGPELVTLDEVGPLGELSLKTVVNGETVQEALTSLMIFDIPTLVSVVSEFASLEPGDLILTGTPSGVGFRRDPPLLMKPGDVVAVEISGVGRIENHFVG